MADEQLLALLRQGPDAWSLWRSSNASSRVDLTGADLSYANLSGANLGAHSDGYLLAYSRGFLFGANLTGANLTGANLSGANLTSADLIAATLSRVDLSRAELSGLADLTGADLSGAKLIGANLSGAKLIRANLTGADLAGADLYLADLIDADLTGANLSGANLSTATLTDAKLTDARLNETVLSNVDLSQTEGLDGIQHDGPSVIDHRTLFRSGRLPLAFLRGCGLPDRLIDYLPSLLNDGPIQFYSCFISYSTANQDFAERLHADLQSRGVRCWFAPHDMQPGKKIHEQVDEAIRIYDRLLLILSAESMSSRWVKTEIAKARKKEVASNRRVLFPIAVVPYSEVGTWTQFNADLGEDTAEEIREYFLPDFSGRYR